PLPLSAHDLRRAPGERHGRGARLERAHRQCLASPARDGAQAPGPTRNRAGHSHRLHAARRALRAGDAHRLLAAAFLLVYVLPLMTVGVARLTTGTVAREGIA